MERKKLRHPFVKHVICFACQMEEANPNQTFTIHEKVEVGDEGGLRLFVAGFITSIK